MLDVFALVVARAPGVALTVLATLDDDERKLDLLICGFNFTLAHMDFIVNGYYLSETTTKFTKR